MKLLIAVDMEGITGVTSWDHVDPSKPDYSRFRRLMTADVNAAIQGAFEGGIDEVLVTDGHNLGSNILIEELDERAVLNSGLRPDLCMVSGVENGVDAVILVGYHARAGSRDAILCHTFTLAVNDLTLNGQPMGEIGMAAAVSGYYNLPVILVCGDAAACREAQQQLPGVETAVVKTSSGQFASECLPPEASHTLIRSAARKAVENFKKGKAPQALKVSAPLHFQLQFKTPAQADSASLLPGFTRLDGTTFEFQGEDIPHAYRVFAASLMLGH